MPSACEVSHFSRVQLFAALQTVVSQAPRPIGILQARIQEWVVVPSSRASPNPGIEPVSLMSPALAGRFFITSTTWEAPTKGLHTFISVVREFSTQKNQNLQSKSITVLSFVRRSLNTNRFCGLPKITLSRWQS